MSSPIITPQRHVAPIVGRMLPSAQPDLSFNSSADSLDALRAERGVAQAHKLVDRKVTQFTNSGSLNSQEIAVIASASNALAAPKGATGPAINHQRNASAQVVDEIMRIKPDIVVVAGSSIDPNLSAAAKSSGATLARIPFAAK